MQFQVLLSWRRPSFSAVKICFLLLLLLWCTRHLHHDRMRCTNVPTAILRILLCVSEAKHCGSTGQCWKQDGMLELHIGLSCQKVALSVTKCFSEQTLLKMAKGPSVTEVQLCHLCFSRAVNLGQQGRTPQPGLFPHSTRWKHLTGLCCVLQKQISLMVLLKSMPNQRNAN